MFRQSVGLDVTPTFRPAGLKGHPMLTSRLALRVKSAHTCPCLTFPGCLNSGVRSVARTVQQSGLGCVGRARSAITY